MITETIKEQTTAALKEGDKKRATTLRSLTAILHNEKIKKGDELTDEEVIKSLKTEVKKRDEALEAFEKAGRSESAENEKREKELILTFLPQQMSEEEIGVLIDEVLASSEDKSNFGVLMREVMAKAGSSADGGTVSKLLKEKI